MTIRISSVLEILVLVLNAERLASKKRTRVSLSLVARVQFPRFLHALISFFLFRKNHSPSFALFVLDSSVLRNLHTLIFPGKASFPYILMIGFESVNQECPSISFFFARLGVFLKYSAGRCPQVGLFVPHTFVLKPVLFFLYPLIWQSLILYHFEMDSIKYRADNVRSSELETGLSSSAETLNKIVDTTVSRLPSSTSSCPLHTLSESCFLKESHLKGFRKGFQFPKGTSIRLPRLGEKACNFAHGEVCLYEADFLCGLRFPVHPFIMHLLNEFQIAPGQLVPNAWRKIISCMSIWVFACDEEMITLNEFLFLYRL